VKRHYKEI